MKFCMFTVLDANSLFSGLLGAKLDVLGHGIGLAQLVVGVIGLGTVVGGRFYMKRNQRETRKFVNSLLEASIKKVENMKPILTRGPMTEGADEKPFYKLNLSNAFKSVALIGPSRSGKTVFLCNTILKEMYPWWNRYIFPSRGFFLTGSKKPANIDAWLRHQIATSDKDDPWAALKDLVSQRYMEQRVRRLLKAAFGDALPAFLKPQPPIIVIDQAEELLATYRADFLIALYDLVKETRDDKVFRLVLIINTQQAVKALKLLNGGNMFSVIQAPKVSRDAVVGEYGEEFAKIFKDCDDCIGVALDYQYDKERLNGMSAKDYAEMKKKQYMSDNCLMDEITREEYMKAGERSKKLI